MTNFRLNHRGFSRWTWTAIFALAALCQAPATPPSGYYLVWSDEFDYFDWNKWTKYTGSHRDAVNADNAVSVSGGHLFITTYTSGGTHYTGMIASSGKFLTKFGFLEASIDWSDSAGMWSAFWLQADPMDDCPYQSRYLGDPTTAGAEIDICEHRSQDGSGNYIADQVQANLHWDGYSEGCSGNYTSTGSGYIGSGLNSGMHTYGLLWNSSEYQIYVDNAWKYTTASGNSEHSEWIMLSSEVLNGGWSGSIPSGGYGSLSSSTTKMQVDYVRYYAPNSMVFWDGSSSAYWTNNANWVANKSVPSGGDVVFSLLSKGNYSSTLGQDYTLDSLTFLETSFITLNGNKLTINDVLDMNSAWNDAAIYSDVGLGNANTWRIGANRTLRVHGDISGGHSLNLWGYGTVALYGNNSYTLGTVINRGTLRIHSDNALGSTASGTTVANGAQLLVYASLASGEPLGLDGNGTSSNGALRVGNGASAAWNGAITLANAATIKLDGGASLAINGNIGGGHSLRLAADGGAQGIVSGAINTGAFSVTKSGAGSWTLAGANSFTGALNVDTASTSSDDGILTLANGAAIAGASSIQIQNNNSGSSTLRLDGTSGGMTVTPPISLNGRNNAVAAIENLAGNNTLSGALTLNAGGLEYRLQSDAGTLALSGRISSGTSNPRTLTFQGDGNFLVSGIITNGSSSSFSLLKSGNGTLTLSAANTCTGGTTNTSGTLALGVGGSISNCPVIHIANGTTFDVSQTGGGFWLSSGQNLVGGGTVRGNTSAAAGSTITPGDGVGTLTFSNHLTLSGAVLAFELTKFPDGTNDAIAIAGNLNLSGLNTLQISLVSGSLPTGRYKLITYGGARTGGAANFSVAVSGVPAQVVLMVDDSVTNEIALLVTSFAGSLVWRGDGGQNLWDGGTSANWYDGTNACVFLSGDSVTFDNSATNLSVSLAGSLLPGLVTVSNANNYTFAGSGRISGASGLVKTGSGTLTVLATNNNTGAIEIEGGTVQVGNGAISGSIGSGDVINNGTLLFNIPNTVTVGGAVSGSGTLLKQGVGMLALGGNSSFSGGTVIASGSVSNASSAGFGSGPVLITNLALQVVLGAGVTVSNAITLGGPVCVVATGALKGPASGSATLAGPISLTVNTPNGGATTNGGAFDGGNTSAGLIVSGPVTSTGGAVHQRANRVTFSGGGSYKLFQSSQGTTALGADNGLATNAVLEVGSTGGAATFDLAGFNQVLNGLQKGAQTATVGNSSAASDSLLTISGSSSNTTFAGTIQDSVGGGTRQVALAVSGGTFTLSAANTFSGETRPMGGTLALASSSAIQNSTLNLAEGDSGVVSFGALTSATLGGLAGSRGLALVNNSAAAVALTAGRNNTGTNIYSGSLSGAGSLTKTGSGMQVLNGTNTFTGALNVDTAQPSAGNDGILRIASPSALGNISSIAIRNQSDAYSILQLDGSAGNITVNKDVKIACRRPIIPAVQSVSGTNTITGNVWLDAGGSFGAFACDTGLLVFTGTNQYIGSLTAARNYIFTGAGDHRVAGPILNSTNGAVISLIKTGSGRLTLEAANTYGGPSTVSNGTLLVNGSLGTNMVTVFGGTLGGSGLIRGAVSILESGAISPGSSLGTLTISNSLALLGTTYMELNQAARTNDLLRGMTSVAYGGALCLSNLAGTLTPADSFKLFSANAYNGAFSTLLPAIPAPGLGWNTNTLATDGILRIVSTVNTTPTNLVSAVDGTMLTLSWPADRIGWRLQSQTNVVTIGLGTNWSDVPGSALTNLMSFPLDAGNGAVFYRMVFP